MSDDNQWRWAEADGSTHACSFDELQQMLRTEELPPYVLVWNAGWGSWLSARNVAELAPALGPRAQPRMAPIRMPGLQTPPRPPLSKYKAVGHPSALPIYKKTAKGAAAAFAPAPTPAPTPAPAPEQRPSARPPPPPPLARADARTSRPPPPPSMRARVPQPGQPTTLPGTPPPPSLPPPPTAAAPRGPVPIRDVMPTLTEDAPGLDRATLRPARAVAPPPRMLPREPLSGGLPLPPDVPGESEAPESVPISEGPALLPLPPVVAKAPVSIQTTQTPLPTAGSAPPQAPPAATEAEPSAPARTKIPTGPVRTALIVAASIPVVAFLAYLSRDEDGSRNDTDSSEQPAASAGAVDPSREGALAPTQLPGADSMGAVRSCEVAHRAERLAGSAHLGVPPIAASISDGKMALGFASSPTDAVGLTVDLASAEAQPVFARSTRNGILGVVPGVEGGKTTFYVDVAGSPLVGLRTIPTNPPFAVGVTAEGFARRAGGNVTVLWQSVTGADEITTPRIASNAEGHVLVTRVGGKTGRVMVGWLGLDGSPKGDLQQVTTDAAEIGNPGVTLSGSEAVVSFAARGAEPEAPWGIRLAVVKRGQPAKAETYAISPGGPGGPVISPATDALGAGRFLLVWTEGAPGNRDVRAQVLGNDLVKHGDPITLSPSGSNAGQGVPFTQGQRALVVFYVKNETSQELWGATLACR